MSRVRTIWTRLVCLLKVVTRLEIEAVFPALYQFCARRGQMATDSVPNRLREASSIRHSQATAQLARKVAWFRSFFLTVGSTLLNTARKTLDQRACLRYSLPPRLVAGLILTLLGLV